MKQTIHSGPFNTGGYAQSETKEPIDKFTNRPKMKNSGLKDHLYEALAPHKVTAPRDNHPFKHSSHPQASGAHYTPAGEFGHTARTGAGRGVYSYGGNQHSATPGNAVGNPPNRRGDNAVGHAPNRRGQNANGNPPQRRGTNAVGNPPNRVGNNALGSRFVPRGGGHKP